MFRFLYRLFKNRWDDAAVEEFIATIPDHIKAPTVRVFSDYKKNLEKLAMFQAYQLHRKMATDQKFSERYQGMFVALKLYHSMIERAPATREQMIEEQETKQEDDKFSQAMEGITKFLKGKDPEKTEEVA